MTATSTPPPDPDADVDPGATPVPVVQESLPLDGAVPEAPIPFALTARARRVVAPGSLPDLAVVSTGPAARHEPGGEIDTRAARARALRRSGRSVAAIAKALAAEPGQVAQWTGDVETAGLERRRGRHTTTRAVNAATPADIRDDDGARPEAAARASGRAAFEQRAGAGDVPTLVAAGIVAASCDVQRHAVVLGVRDLDAAAVALRALGVTVGVALGTVRVTVVAGSAVARDLERARWSRALGVASEHVTVAPWPDAPTGDAVRASIRIADRTLAAVVAGWKEAALDALRTPLADPTGA